MHGHHDFDLFLTVMNADCGFMADLTVVSTANVDDGDRDLGGGDPGAASTYDEEGHVICTVWS